MTITTLLRTAILIFMLAAPVWIGSYAILMYRLRRAVSYFELRQLKGRGRKNALLAFYSWNLAIAMALIPFGYLLLRMTGIVKV